jgi:hypothetical protein
MTGSREGSSEAQKRRRAQARVAGIEADLAYFQARIEILGEPETVNQRAQRRAFTALYAVFAKRATGAGGERPRG